MIKNIEETKFNGVYVIEPVVYSDNRGCFFETYNLNEYRRMGINVEFVQDNHSISHKGVIRGLHYQKRFPQGKLIRVINGEIFDVVVDIREQSKTFLSWHGVILSAFNKKELYVEPGFAHGFLVLSDVAEVCYKCTDFYHPDDDHGIAWNDPNIGIEWKDVIGEYQGNATSTGYFLKDGSPIILSEKDQSWDNYKFFDVKR